jgi:hypothetical protein
MFDLFGVVRRLFGRYDARYDVNRDGRINLLDVLLVTQQLGRRC